MLKMYNAEVLSKFPVVQHFPFGGLFEWEADPDAEEQQASIHVQSHSKPARTLVQENAKAPSESQRASRTTVQPTKRL